MKYLISILLFGLPVFQSFVYAQNLEEAISFGSDHQDFVFQIEKAPNGDIFAVGGTTNIADLNPKGIAYTVQAPGVDKSNAFIARYNSDMTLVWAKTIGNTGWDEGRQLVLDDSLNVYVMGYGEGVVDFDPSGNVNSLDLSYGGYFLAKYGYDGVFKAVTQVTDVYPSQVGERLLKDSNGNIYAYTGTFLTKFTSNLNVLWIQETGGMPTEMNGDDIKCIRNFKGTDYTPSPDEEQEIALETYTFSAGTFLNTTLLGHTNGEIIQGYATQTPEKDLLIYGKYWGTLTFYGGGDSITVENYTLNAAGLLYEPREFVCRYDENGNLLWAKAFQDKGPNPVFFRIDDDGNIYTLGKLHYTSNFDPVNPFIYTPPSQFGVYIAKYDSAFNFQELSQVLTGHPVVHDYKWYNDTTMICGSFNDVMDADPSANEETLESNGYHDAFMIKYSGFGIEDPVSVEEYTGNPNPFNTFVQAGRLNVDIDTGTKDEAYTLTLYDAAGRQLTSVQSYHTHIELDVSAYPKAVYIVQVRNNQWSASKRMIIQNN